MPKRPAQDSQQSNTATHGDNPTLARDLLAVFRDVHRHGHRALEEGDLKTFGEAVAVERSLIQEQREALQALTEGGAATPRRKTNRK